MAPLALLGLAGTSGCSTYNQRVEAPIRAFERGQFDSAAAQFSDPSVTGSAFLSGAEAGMAAFVGGRFSDALGHLHDAEDAASRTEERALLGVESLGESVTSFFLNEGQAEYVGEGYERVMLHAVLGLCYLALGKPDDVLVEARLIDELITTEEELYEASYGAGGIGHFLSALAYELKRQPGEAYVDYVRMHEKGLAPGLVGASLIRLARDLGRRDDLERWLERYGSADPVPDDWPSIVVVGGLGMGPAKYETRIDVALPRGIFSWAVPQFGAGAAPTAGLELVFPDTGTRVRSSELEDVSAVAKRNLDDRIAWLATRSAVRGILKHELARQLTKSDNDWVAGLGGVLSIVSIFSERADLRAWRTLPDAWVAARAFVPPGEDLALVLGEIGGSEVALGRYRLEEGETMFVLARALDSGLVVQVLGGEEVDAAETYVDPPIEASP